MKKMQPSYIELAKTGELSKRKNFLMEQLKSCKICPRECGVDRTAGELGFCNAGLELRISGVNPHFGEEAPLVGSNGSGTVFLTGCNLKCIYCQNYDISQLDVGETVSTTELAKRMMKLQKIGCHNINFVTPTHFISQLVSTIGEAQKMGLEIPIVYNCGGYEKVETLKLLEDIVDIYMPDMKYGRSADAKKYSKAKDYPEICFKAVLEMHRQVGDLVLDDAGVAYHGLLVRHLVLPGSIAGSEEIFKFISEKISKRTYINIMDQYRPEFKAGEYKELDHAPTRDEYNKAVTIARDLGLTRGEIFRHKSVLNLIQYLR